MCETVIVCEFEIVRFINCTASCLSNDRAVNLGKVAFQSGSNSEMTILS